MSLLKDRPAVMLIQNVSIIKVLTSANAKIGWLEMGLLVISIYHTSEYYFSRRLIGKLEGD